jgi:hypothetical protein
VEIEKFNFSTTVYYAEAVQGRVKGDFRQRFWSDSTVDSLWITVDKMGIRLHWRGRGDAGS